MATKFGKKAITITKDAVLAKVSSYDIYRHYLGASLVINDVIVNTLRGEKDPSLIVGNKVSGDLTHKDFGDYEWRGDCFNLVEKYYNCDFVKALEHINRDMRLGITDHEDNLGKPASITWKQPNIELRPPPKFEISVRRFNNDELQWWNKKYSLDRQDLKIGNVYAPRIIRRNGKVLPITLDSVFCYWYPEIEKWKIYRPEKTKKKEKGTPNYEWKWDSNVPFNYCDSLSTIVPGTDLGIIAKSRKDKMVLRKALGINSIADLQAEDPSALTSQTLEIFDKNVKLKLAVMDNDKKGKEMSWWLTTQHGYKHCNVPDKYLIDNMTDFADTVEPFGLDFTRNYFIEKGFIKI